MAAATRLSYQRLRNYEEGGEDGFKARIRIRIRWPSRLKRFHMKKRLKMKILPSFMRRKARAVAASLAKVLKRLKESQSHFGDLFAGNYLFLQVNPTPLKRKSSSPSSSSSSHAITVTRESYPSTGSKIDSASS